MTAIQLIVGLGNPGPEYDQTRHNAGALFVESIANKYNAPLASDRKYFGLVGSVIINGQNIKLLIPTTYMNRSGQSVAALANFYRIPMDAILVAHDELDLPPGTVKLKHGGGHGGHNGLRDIIAQCANQNIFYRLRLGIGHPGHKNLVSGFVLTKASKQEQQLLLDSIDNAIDVLPEMVTGDWSKAMHQLHTQKA